MSKKSRSPKARETRDSGQSQEEAAQWEQENFPFALQSMPCPSLAALCCRKQPLLTPAASVHASGVQIPFLLSLPLSYAVCFIVDSLPYQPDLFSAQVRQHLSRQAFLPHRRIHPTLPWSSSPVLQEHTGWFILLCICLHPCPLGSECGEICVRVLNQIPGVACRWNAALALHLLHCNHQ